VGGNNSVLVFTYIGYASQEIVVGNKTNVVVSLALDANQKHKNGEFISIFKLICTKHRRFNKKPRVMDNYFIFNLS